MIEIARRISTNRRVLDIYTNPLPTFRQSTMDAETRFGVVPDDTPEESQAKIVRGMNALLEQGVISVEDIVADLTFLQPNVQGVHDCPCSGDRDEGVDSVADPAYRRWRARTSRHPQGRP